MIQINFTCTCGFTTESLSEAFGHTMTNWALKDNHREVTASVDDESLRKHLVSMGTIEPCAEDE